MGSLKARLTGMIKRLRERHPMVDHVVRMQQHYGKAGAAQQAGAVTYFAFLSFFPILALAFFVVGWAAKVYPEAQNDLVKAINSLLPELVGTEDGQISVTAIQDAAGAVGLLGLAGVLYAGLGWLSAMRDALEAVFEEPRTEQPGFLAGKLRDLTSLGAIGVVMLLSIAVAGFVTGFTGLVLGWVGLDNQLDWLVTLIARVIGFGANVLLFFSLFKLLVRPHAPNRSLWHGALLGAIVFEALKAASFLLLASTKGQPAFQAFGIALILVVWMNYFSRVVLYAASWAHTSRASRAIREREEFERRSMEEFTRVELHEAPIYASAPQARSTTTSFAAGGATTLALLALLRKKKD